METGRVIQHLAAVYLKNCTYKVSQAGRQRVLREKRKNVHAMVVGELVTQSDNFPQSKQGFRPVYYNPYKVSTFVDRETQEPLTSSDFVFMGSDRQVIALQS